VNTFSVRLALYLSRPLPPLGVLYRSGGTFYRMVSVPWTATFVFDPFLCAYFDRRHPISDRFEERSP